MKKLFILAAVAMTMVACNNDENSYSPAPSDGLIHLTASVKTSDGTTRASAAGELQNAAFVAGKTIFVEAYETGEATAYASGTYTTGDAGALTGELHYPANNHAIDLCAYYPGDISSSSTAFSVQTDQSADAGYQASDLMYATKLTNKGSNATHNLVFNHALTKVVVNIVAGEGVTSENITGTPGVTAVKLNNTKPDAQLAIANGVITASQASSGSAADINITGTGASNVGIIVPQQVAAGAFITVTYNSIDYVYSLPEAKTFEGGKVYTYTLTLGAKAITLTATSINEWTAGTGGEGEFDLDSFVGEFVDLGLPSGTKWATYNVGANSETDYGDYFACGATEPWYSSLSPLTWKEGKSAGYTLANTPYNNGSSGSWSKYTGSDYTTLQPEDDAAHVLWGGQWRMPTFDDWNELNNTSYTTWTWTTMSGVNGYKVAKVSDASVYIFLPATGYRSGNGGSSTGSSAWYWSSTPILSSPGSWSIFEISSYMHKTNQLDGRYYGSPIRPVFK